MAIRKAKMFRGKEADYWAIVKKTWDKLENKTSCVLGLYFSRQARVADVKNLLEGVNFVFQGELTTSQLYDAIKAPILNENDENTNWFSDVIDVVEEA